MEIYVVQPDDTVDQIAEKTGADTASIISTNQLEYPYRLAVGQALLISKKNEQLTEAEKIRRRQIESSGYAYPFISDWVLDQTLPYLSELAVFSYGFTTQGDLIYPTLDDRWMVNSALLAEAKPTLTLTPLGKDGHFNNGLVSALVRQQDVQLKLLRNLVWVMTEKGYQGVNIDFEYVLPEDRDSFSAFVGRATNLLNQFGFYVTVALAPKYSDNQKGVLYEGMDYRALGQAANWVFLMTYEWGYTYGPPMAVAPVNQVRRVVEYALTRIPAYKICMGVPNYGYDWPLPYVRGTTKARTLGNIEAVQMAIFYGVPIGFDQTAQSPYFTYWQYGVEHQVWFEDVRSYQAKFKLVEEYSLRGIGVWQINQLFRAGWELLDYRFQIEKN
ncbi:MAG: LysM peptidoglycan-binding domain-containing protein [Hungatella sp.]|jgi:spore germination protein|nr:LysM peptidoglycan-binding domain-containing protein [Hungatella sp.]